MKNEFSPADTAKLVLLIHKKFNCDFSAGAAAWNGMVQNRKHISVSEWEKLHTAAIKYNFELCYPVKRCTKNLIEILASHT